MIIVSREAKTSEDEILSFNSPENGCANDQIGLHVTWMCHRIDGDQAPIYPGAIESDYRLTDDSGGHCVGSRGGCGSSSCWSPS